MFTCVVFTRTSERAEREDVKGTRRMPWQWKPKKDATSCDNPRGAARGLRSGGFRTGEPRRRHGLRPPPEHIGRTGATRGTETSKYPEEEKSTEIPLVAASERGPRANRREREPRRGCRTAHSGVRNPRGSGTAWEGRRDRVRAPYAKPRRAPGGILSTAGHVKPGGKQGGPPSNPKYSPLTDSAPVP